MSCVKFTYYVCAGFANQTEQLLPQAVPVVPESYPPLDGPLPPMMNSPMPQPGVLYQEIFPQPYQAPFVPTEPSYPPEKQLPAPYFQQELPNSNPRSVQHQGQRKGHGRGPKGRGRKYGYGQRSKSKG